MHGVYLFTEKILVDSLRTEKKGLQCSEYWPDGPHPFTLTSGGVPLTLWPRLLSPSPPLHLLFSPFDSCRPSDPPLYCCWEMGYGQAGGRNRMKLINYDWNEFLSFVTPGVWQGEGYASFVAFHLTASDSSFRINLGRVAGEEGRGRRRRRMS